MSTYLLAELAEVAPLFAASSHYRWSEPQTADPAYLAAQVEGRRDVAVVVLRNDAGRPIAAAVCYLTGGGFGPLVYWIHHMVVDETLRGQGLGRRLIAEVARVCPAGVDLVGLGIRNENERMATACTAWGFEVYRIDPPSPQYPAGTTLYRAAREVFYR